MCPRKVSSPPALKETGPDSSPSLINFSQVAFVSLACVKLVDPLFPTISRAGKTNIALFKGASKAALSIAVRYAATRLAVGPSGKSDTPIMSYQLQQNAIVPLIARTVAINAALDRVKLAWANQNPDGSEHAQVVIQCCAMKPVSGWNLKVYFSLVEH